MAQRKSTFHILQAAAQCSSNPQNEDVLKLCIALPHLLCIEMSECRHM